MSEWRTASDELVEGLAALKLGQREKARQLLARAICADPHNAAAWFWLSRCLDDEDRRRECLEQALCLEPANEALRRALGQEAGESLRRIVGAGAGGGRAFHSPHHGFSSRTVSHKPVNSNETIETSAFRGAPGLRGLETSATFAARATFAVRRLLLSALALAVVALVCVLAPRLGWLVSQAQLVDGEALEASGVIRADEVLIASQWSGRIAAIPVDEGAAVAAGDVIVRLDTSLLDAQIKAARVAVAVVEAGLTQAKAGARPGQIAVAEAQLLQAEAIRAAATQAVSDTLALVENPQDIRLQIAVTQAQAEAAQHHVARAVAIKDAAEIGKDRFEDVQDKWGGGGRQKVLVRRGPVSELPAVLPPEIIDRLPPLGDGVYTFGDLELHLHGGTYDLYKWVSVHVPLELHLMPNNWWQAWVGVNAAVAQQEGLQASLAHLYTQRARPQSLEARADEALASLAQAKAQVAAAQAQVDGLKAGAAEEQIAALEARVAQAHAALGSLLIQRAMMEIVSPVDGTVVDIAAHPGEVAAPGASLLTVADLSQVSLVVYVPENRVAQVHLGQGVQVTVDSFPGRIFEGEVIHIADRAEFTPRNVTTKEERVNLVFAVDIRLPNDDGALKPGMPADAVFGK